MTFSPPHSVAFAFIYLWRFGQLPVGFKPCRTGQIYEAFIFWCAQVGVPFPPKITMFNAALLNAELPYISPLQIVPMRIGADARCVRMVFMNDEQKEFGAEWAENCIDNFAVDLDRWKGLVQA